MCDNILVVDNKIRTCESDLHYLNIMLTLCDKSKGYKCELISEKINEREMEITRLREEQIKNVELCTLYRNLQNEYNKKYNK